MSFVVQMSYPCHESCIVFNLKQCSVKRLNLSVINLYTEDKYIYHVHI